MKAVEVIRLAYGLIKDRSRWTQGANAKDKQGNAVAPTFSEATCWCGIGALEAVAGPSCFVAVSLLQRVSEEMYGGDHVQILNDGHRPMVRIPEDAHRVVLGIYERCLEKYKDDPPLIEFVKKALPESETEAYIRGEFSERYKELLAVRWPLIRAEWL